MTTVEPPTTDVLWQQECFTQAAKDVLAERQRQIAVLGRDAEHDDETSFDGNLASAGATYALNAAGMRIHGPIYHAGGQVDDLVPLTWPTGWSADDWKPKTPREDLVRAGALIIAEIDRIDRADRAELERQRSMEEPDEPHYMFEPKEC